MTAVAAPAAPQGILVTISEAARLLRVCNRTIYDLTVQKKLRCVRIGRRVLYRPADLDAYVATAAGE